MPNYADTIQFATETWTEIVSTTDGFEQYRDGVSDVVITDTRGITIDGMA